jgi:phosphate uptake regulator
MTEKHLSSQFDAELNTINAHLLEMGGLVESQVANAMKAFSTMDAELASEVLANEKAVNDFEINIDKECAEILARRQPTAKDLRLVLAIAKAIKNNRNFIICDFQGFFCIVSGHYNYYFFSIIHVKIFYISSCKIINLKLIFISLLCNG